MRWALLIAALAAARGAGRRTHASRRAFAPRPRAPVNLAPRAAVTRATSVRDFRNSARGRRGPIALRCTKTGRTIDCFPGCFMRLEDEGEWYVVATPCDQPVASRPDRRR